MIDIIKKEQCTGCKMCADICPQEAISFFSDNEGFWYPKVDPERCIECGICIKRCPSLVSENSKIMDEPVVYSAWSRDDETRVNSTSGGVFFEIAKYFISVGGIVVGSQYSKNWRSAEHVIGRNMDDVQKIMGSKYFQSDTSRIYRNVKKELLQGKKVLFCGTPCQCAALYSFLGQEFDNLYYMDFICRSINSPMAFKAYIDELEKEYSSNVVEVHLKNKKYGWSSLASQVKFENGKETIRDKNHDWWVKGFVHNDLYTRESCYHCIYKTLPRKNADITIGDFWGIKNQKEEDMFKGISVVLLNSEKGKKLFDSCKDVFDTKIYNIDDVLPENPALLKNPIKSKKQDQFFEMIKTYSFSEAVKKCTKKSLVDILRGKVKRVYNLVKRVYEFAFKRDLSITKYIYYNYFCKNIVKHGTAKILPHKNAILELSKESKIHLYGSHSLNIGYNRLKKSKSETHIRMQGNAVWYCRNGADLFYNTVLEINDGAVFDTHYFSANGGSVIIADKKITFGEDVMIGRNVIIYDSDFHQLRDMHGKPINPPKAVVIEDHVWLTSNITILKGVTIGRGSLVTAQTVINKSMPEHSIIAAKSSGKIIKDQVIWNRERCIHE